MANPEHVKILSLGVTSWNSWRRQHPEIIPDLSDCFIPRNLSILSADPCLCPAAPDEDFTGTVYSGPVPAPGGINFTHVNFHRATFEGGNYCGADFHGSNLYEADMSRARLCYTNLRNCHMRKAYLDRTNLKGTHIINSNLSRATLTNAVLTAAILQNCIVYGASAWGLVTDKSTLQQNLMMEDTNYTGEQILEDVTNTLGYYPLMVDDIELAQFIHFIKNYRNLGKGLSVMLEKGVLLLGKFKDGGRAMLEFVATEIRKRQLIPIIFDFDSPRESNLVETVTVLAGMSRFVVANLNGRSVPAEIERITANFRRPVIAYYQEGEDEGVYAMLSDKLGQVSILQYRSQEDLAVQLPDYLQAAENQLQHSMTETERLIEARRNNTK